MFAILPRSAVPIVAALAAVVALPGIVRGQPRQGEEFDALTAALALEKTFERVIEDAEKSVVSIARYRPQEAAGRRAVQPLFDPDAQEPVDPTSPEFIPNSFGSGIVIAPLNDGKERFILTNYHVVKGGPAVKQAGEAKYRLYVRLANRKGFHASILAADPRADLAVLKIDFDALKMKPDELPPLKLGSRDKYRKGQLVLALGNPYAQARDGSASASWGMISNIARKPQPLDNPRSIEGRKEETLHHLGTLLQVDARLNLGFSGGALLNLKGELIGITTSLAAIEGYETSVGYAVPFDASVRRIIVSLAKGLEAEYGFLGVAPQDVAPSRTRLLPQHLKREFATMVMTVHSDSPAGRAGIGSGDVILDVDGLPVFGRYDLMREIGKHAPGSVATLRVWRAATNRELDVKVRLGKWPVVNEEDVVATEQRHRPWRGVDVDYPTARMKFLQVPISEYHRGVVVTNVNNPELAKSRDLQPGDFITHVNDAAVETPDQFHAAVRNLQQTVTLRLHTGARVRVAP